MVYSCDYGEDSIFEINMALRCEVKALKEIIKGYESGDRYLKIQRDNERVVAGYIKEIARLRKEVEESHIQAVTVRNIWMDQAEELWETNEAVIASKNKKIRLLEDKILTIQGEYDRRIDALISEQKDKVFELECTIDALKNKLAHAEALLDRDSTNTGTPTSQTPPGKKKHVPNSRRGSGKSKGGQPGHAKHELEMPPEEEITDYVEHKLEEGAYCPECNCTDLVFTSNTEERCVFDVEIVVKKTKHSYWEYQCSRCGEILWTGMDPNHWAKCSYGPMVQALALSLMNTANCAINKVPMILSGMTLGEISPCDAYISKLMKRGAKRLTSFMDDLKNELVKRRLIYWDDTVVMADKKRICLRFYGDETIAYYVAHEKKDMEGIREDGILEVLTDDTWVMHDHNTINYNPAFFFSNIECNIHLERDLQRIVDETGHEVFKRMKELISGTIKERNDLIAKGETAFPERTIKIFDHKLDALMKEAEEVAEENDSEYSGQFERAVVRRLYKYKDNYFAWVRDFTLPTTNNLAERGLRPAKSKMKISGQFASVETSNNYAMIRSYIETCRRNGLNEMTALTRLCEGNPITVEEIFSTG